MQCPSLLILMTVFMLCAVCYLAISYRQVYTVERFSNDSFTDTIKSILLTPFKTNGVKPSKPVLFTKKDDESIDNTISRCERAHGVGNCRISK